MRDTVRITRVDYDAEKEYGITGECDTDVILECFDRTVVNDTLAVCVPS